MPAELLREGRLTRAVDSYSFAILLWELFSGQMLHTGLTVAQVTQPATCRCSCETAVLWRYKVDVISEFLTKLTAVLSFSSRQLSTPWTHT